MELLQVNFLPGKTDFYLEESIRNLPDIIKSNYLFLTDENLLNLYPELFKKDKTIVIAPGESSKELKTAEQVYLELLEMGADRKTMLIGIGGGVVCDITGFVASTYMRGIKFGFVPTTVLAMADAAIGGKNGVNLEGYKNIIGCFRQPEFVLYDFNFLNTLHLEEFDNGYPEILKIALLVNNKLYDSLNKNYKLLLNYDIQFIKKIIIESLKSKLEVVLKDEQESQYRMILNFGHTIGHALEKAYYLTHGEAVAIGMATDISLSGMKGYLNKQKAKSINLLFDNLNLNNSIIFDKSHIISLIRKDKKKESNNINYIFLKDIGEPLIEKITYDELEGLIYDLH